MAKFVAKSLVMSDGVRWRNLRWMAAAAAVLLSASVLQAALPPTGDVAGRTSFTGELLVAAPQLREPPFAQAVILVAQHNQGGALGIVINKPAGERPLADVLRAIGADAGGVSGSVPLLFGGPVSPETAFVVHSAEYRRNDTVAIDGRIALTAGVEALRDIGLGKGPSKRLVAFGYAGWAAQQLDDEVARGDWYTVSDDPALVFDDDRAKLWTDALARHSADH